MKNNNTLYSINLIIYIHISYNNLSYSYMFMHCPNFNLKILCEIVTLKMLKLILFIYVNPIHNESAHLFHRNNVRKMLGRLRKEDKRKG